VTCDDVRHQLLETEPCDLRIDGSSPLAEHLLGCGDCRRVAQLLLAEQEGLTAAFDRLAPTQIPAPVRRRWLAEPRSRERRTPRLARWLRVAAATAAVILVSVWFGPKGDEPLRLGVTVADRAPIRETTIHRVSGDYAVMQTDNPLITVVWIMP